MSELKDLTVEAFAQATASDAPAPGGGSVSATVGALGAALAEMVANLTVGKKGYEAQEVRMKEIADEGAALRAELIGAIRKDSESFTGFMEALAMPKDTEEQKKVRTEKMQEGLKTAALAPLEAAECAMKIFPLAEEVVVDGNKNALTDGLISAILARGAVLGALANVRINLASIKDTSFTEETMEKVKRMEREAIAYEKRILEKSAFTAGLL